jgi:hypothetical protein
LAVAVVAAVSWLVFLSGPSAGQVLNAIGGPPGFTRGTQTDNGAYQDYSREYDGTASAQAERTWAVDRLEALGLSKVHMFGESTVVAACGQWNISIAVDYMHYGGPPPGPGTSAVSVEVESGASGAPSCPGDLG